ncbi:MAG: hypothetical protein ACRDKS_09275 [Actinomycetota bacterium]
MRKATIVRAATIVGALALTAAACGGGGKTTTATKQPKVTNKVTIEATEFAFKVSGSITTGQSDLVFTNTGGLDHMLTWARLKPGATPQQLGDLLLQDKGEELLADPSDAERSPILTGPGEKFEFISDVFTQPGTYALLCFIPAPDGQPHVAKGMVGSLEVTQGTASPVSIQSDGEIKLDGKPPTLPAKLSSGRGTFKVTNAGTETHSIGFVRVEPGVTYEVADKYFNEKFDQGKTTSGTPPAVIAGNLFTLQPGTSAYIVLALKPGRYIVACFEGGDENGENDHADKGERVEVTVA